MIPTGRLDLGVLLATGGGVGFVGFAPGTLGAAVGLLVAAACGLLPPAVEMPLVVGLCLAGVPLCSHAATALGRGKDPGAIVFDELAAVPLALLAVPAADRTPLVLAGGFALFRLFDIAKPYPCRRLERLPDGLGIMADDWAAAAWTAACLAIARGLGWL